VSTRGGKKIYQRILLQNPTGKRSKTDLNRFVNAEKMKNPVKTEVGGGSEKKNTEGGKRERS